MQQAVGIPEAFTFKMPGPGAPPGRSGLTVPEIAQHPFR